MTLRQSGAGGRRLRTTVGGIPASYIAQLVVGLFVNFAATREHRRAARPPSMPGWLRQDIGLPPAEEDKRWWHFR